MHEIKVKNCPFAEKYSTIIRNIGNWKHYLLKNDVTGIYTLGVGFLGALEITMTLLYC